MGRGEGGNSYRMGSFLDYSFSSNEDVRLNREGNYSFSGNEDVRFKCLRGES